MDILRRHSSQLIKAISNNLSLVTNELFSASLISPDLRSDILTTTGVSNYDKSTKLVMAIETELETRLEASNRDQYLTGVCHVLQQHQTLKSIATAILQQLGKYMCTYKYLYVHSYTLGHITPDGGTLIRAGNAQPQEQGPTGWPPRVEQTYLSNNYKFKILDFLSLVLVLTTSTITISTFQLL